jgi:hypothetical protein
MSFFMTQKKWQLKTVSGHVKFANHKFVTKKCARKKPQELSAN